ADAAGVVATACAGIDGVADVLGSARPDGELVAGVEELQRLKAKTAAQEASLLAEIDAREIPRKQMAWGSTADWYTHLAGTTRGEGTHRLVTPAIWTALVARDRHCAFPGCTRPPVMGHAHHIRHWIDGGTTSLNNLVLLCGHHHRTIHHTPWQVRLAADGIPEFLAPTKAGRPPPEWIRHRHRRE
ncbi:HNH endonuclease signature motif containing protein, partial [Nocardioides sp.]|uniref:HNH endonuclease signature motif containing protein n=1 Tax=Nocardioides sp. TaxID=35761 RepID=UPI002ED69F29